MKAKKYMERKEYFNATAISPVFPVSNLKASLSHYESLGFEIEPYAGGGYAFVRAGRAEIHLAEIKNLNPATTTSACFLYVEDADSLYDRWNQSDVGGRLIAPTDTDYGLREFGHIDPDGNLLRIGSSLS